MKQNDSREQLLDYLEHISKRFDFSNYEEFSTIQICKKLNMSRSLASLYLNEFVNKGLAVKITSRPVLYFSKNMLSRKFRVQLKEAEYISKTEFKRALTFEASKMKDFEKAIGFKGSLGYCITQMKSAMNYPSGLPLLITGENGTGRKYLASLIREFCENTGLIRKDSPRNMLRISNHEVTNYSTLLFGENEEGGLIETSSGGTLYIENVSELPENVQEKLGDVIKAQTNSMRLIMSATSDYINSINANLLSSIPVVCKIPSFEERNADEREELVVKFFSEQEVYLDKNIKISKDIIYSFMSGSFESNISDLEKYVKTTCANALLENKSNSGLVVYRRHLPAGLFPIADEMSDQFDKLNYLSEIQIDDFSNSLLSFWDRLIDDFEESEINEASFNEFISRAKDKIQDFENLTLFKQLYADQFTKSFGQIIATILSKTEQSDPIKIPLSFGDLMTRLLFLQRNNQSVINEWETMNAKVIQKMSRFTMNNVGIVGKILDDILLKVNVELNFKASEMNRIVLMIILYDYNRKSELIDTMGVILCHGFSTATSLADAANTMLDKHIFEAIDMPLNTSSQIVLEHLNNFIDARQSYRNILLMVDMGSLENLGKEIHNNMNVGIVTNVTTQFVLEVGNMILQKKSMSFILQEIKNKAVVETQYIPAQVKEKAIIFTSDAGIKAAEELTRLFRESLPRNIPIKLLAYSYENLLKNSEKDDIFQKYSIELLIKPLNLQIQNIRYVSIEEIINYNKIDTVNNVLANYFDKNDLKKFNELLLRNFSLQSIMNNLTVLNAEKLLDLVTETTNRMQQMLNKRFSSKTIISINMHVCFLIERLVTKEEIEDYKDLETFIEENADFVEIVRKCFKPLLERYNVDLPNAEIGYLYDYVYRGEDRVNEL